MKNDKFEHKLWGGVSATSIRDKKLLFLSKQDDFENKIKKGEHKIGGYYHTAWCNMVYPHGGYDGANWDASSYAIVVPLKCNIGRIVRFAPFDTMIYDYIAYDDKSFIVCHKNNKELLIKYNVSNFDNNDTINDVISQIDSKIVQYAGKINGLQIYYFENMEIRQAINIIKQHMNINDVMSYPSFNGETFSYDLCKNPSMKEKLDKYNYHETYNHFYLLLKNNAVDVNKESIKKFVYNENFINRYLKLKKFDESIMKCIYLLFRVKDLYKIEKIEDTLNIIENIDRVSIEKYIEYYNITNINKNTYNTENKITLANNLETYCEQIQKYSSRAINYCNKYINDLKNDNKIEFLFFNNFFNSVKILLAIKNSKYFSGNNYTNVNDLSQLTGVYREENEKIYELLGLFEDSNLIDDLYKENIDFNKTYFIGK